MRQADHPYNAVFDPERHRWLRMVPELRAHAREVVNNRSTTWVICCLLSSVFSATRVTKSALVMESYLLSVKILNW